MSVEPGRGVMLIADFCRHTGLDPDLLEPLMRSGELEGLFHPDGRAFGLLDRPLPSAERLGALGLTVSDDYRPDGLSTYVDDDEPDPDEPNEGGPTWTMSWGDPAT